MFSSNFFSVSIVHTLIFLKHNFAYTPNLLKNFTLHFLLSTVTTINQKLKIVSSVPHLSLMFLTSWSICWPSKISKPPHSTHWFIVCVLPGVHSYPHHSFCLSNSSPFLKTQLSSFSFFFFFFLIFYSYFIYLFIYFWLCWVFGSCEGFL